MSKRLIILFIALVAVAIFFLLRQCSDKSESFSLLDQIEERQVLGVINLSELLTDGKSISNRFRTFGLAEQYFNEVSDVLNKSGIRLDKVFYSLETRNTYKRSIYFEVTDQEQLRKTFEDFSDFYKLTQDSLDTSIYHSKEYGIAIRIKKEWMELIQGDLNDLSHRPSLSNTARNLLEEEYFFVLNPTEKITFDSLEFITGNYHYDSILTIEGSWFCNRSDNHPVQQKSDKINIYSTDKNVISAYLNVSREDWERYKNPYLKEKLENAYSKGMIDYPGLSKHWTGQFAFNFGGKKTISTETTVTEFDENFNQIEKTVLQTDTVRDVGFVFSSNDPKALHLELLNQSNIKTKNGETYIALLPPLTSNYQEDQLILSGSNKKPTVLSARDVLHFKFSSSQLNIIVNARADKKELKYRLELTPQVAGKIKWNELLNVFL